MFFRAGHSFDFDNVPLLARADKCHCQEYLEILYTIKRWTEVVISILLSKISV